MPLGAADSKAGFALGPGLAVNLAILLNFQFLFLVSALCSGVPGPIPLSLSNITFAQVCSSSITNEYSLMMPKGFSGVNREVPANLHIPGTSRR